MLNVEYRAACASKGPPSDLVSPTLRKVASQTFFGASVTPASSETEEMKGTLQNPKLAREKPDTLDQAQPIASTSLIAQAEGAVLAMPFRTGRGV